MFKDMYVAATGFIATQKKLDVISNNLANINTPGFKADQLVFESYLAKEKDSPQGVSTPQAPNPAKMRQSEYVVVSDQYTDFTPGAMKTTGNSLDLAIQGDGFFSVMTSQGERFTRNGAFTVGQNGELVTSEGHVILDDQNRAIKVNDGVVTIDEEGNVWVNKDSGVADASDTTMESSTAGKLVGKLKVVSFPKTSPMTKEGDGLYRAADPAEAISQGGSKVMQGNIEQSNVNMIQQMTELIKNQRLAETYQKAVSESDSMTGQLLVQLGR